MEIDELPYIDEHAVTIGADIDTVWPILSARTPRGLLPRPGGHVRRRGRM